MKAKSIYKALFGELEKWSHQKDSFSVSDFIKLKGVSFGDFESTANSNKKFMKIWESAESKAWENVLNALFKKSLPRSKIAEYIKELNIFEGEDPEEIMQSLEDGQFKFELYLIAIGDTELLRNHGRIGLKMSDTEALMRCCLERGMITQRDYEEIMAIPDDDDGD